MNKADQYTAALREIDIRLEHGGDPIADLGNITAILKKRFAHFYWVGFYIIRDKRLVLGPFQGTPACVFLEMGKGVVGTCAAQKTPVVVPDVHAFSGHVACDPKSKSEIVIPCENIQRDLMAVLDVDSDQVDAFDEVDQRNLELLAERIRPVWSRFPND